MRGMVLAGAMGLLLAVSAEAQQRPGWRGNGGPGMSGSFHGRGAAWFGSGFGPFGAYWRLDAGGRPYAMGSQGYGGYSQSYEYGDAGDSYGYGSSAAEYHSLSPIRYQRSSRGYYILPPNFAAQDTGEPEGDR